MESYADVSEGNFEISSLHVTKNRVVFARMFVIPKESKLLNFQSIKIPPELLMTASFSVMMINA
jgi:hypothetical protein